MDLRLRGDAVLTVHLELTDDEARRVRYAVEDAAGSAWAHPWREQLRAIARDIALQLPLE